MKALFDVPRTASVTAGLIAFALFCDPQLAMVDAQDARAASKGEKGSTVAPPSTIVEIQNHGERFYDESDAAALALNQIAERDESWDAARQAKAAADANPDDERAQEAYRAARARFLHHKIQAFLKAIQFEQAIRQSHAAFGQQLGAEIDAMQMEVKAEEQAVQQYAEGMDDYLAELHKVKARIGDAEDLASEDLKLLREIQLEISILENDKMLAKERQVLAGESLRALQQTKVEAENRNRELIDEFQLARGDLKILRGIAFNDLKFENHAERKKLLARFQNRRPINTSGNRKVLDELLARNRDRLANLGNARPVVDDSDERNRERVREFLNNLPPASTTEPAMGEQEAKVVNATPSNERQTP